MINPIVLIIVFVVCTVLGYFIIRNVPSLLHTPLMSGMNALSGVTIVGAIAATGIAYLAGSGFLAQLAGGLAIVLAAINVFGGFGVTHRMLRMFNMNQNAPAVVSKVNPAINIMLSPAISPNVMKTYTA